MLISLLLIYGLIITSITNPEKPVDTGKYKEYDYAEDVFIQENYAYIADSRLYILDISDKSKPILLSKLYISWSVKNIFVSGDYTF